MSYTMVKHTVTVHVAHNITVQVTHNVTVHVTHNVTVHAAHTVTVHMSHTLSLLQTERDTIQVIGFLRHDAASKDEQISKLEGELKTIRLDSHKQQEQLSEEYQEHIRNLEDTVATQVQQVFMLLLLLLLFNFNGVH